MKRLVVIGASGMVGGCVLRIALENPHIDRVLSVVRKTLGFSHSKLTEVLHPNFADCSTLESVLSDQDAAIFCLGTYTGTVSDAELRVITLDYTTEFARVLKRSSPGAAFAFLSGNGADPTGQSRIAFARYKGLAETALLEVGFPRVYIFRPAYIYPVTPRQEPSFSYRLLRLGYPVFRVLFPNLVIRSDDLGRIMVEVCLQDSGKAETRILENRDILAMVRSAQALNPS